jgi:hypothetical protein
MQKEEKRESVQDTPEPVLTPEQHAELERVGTITIVNPNRPEGKSTFLWI